MEPKARLPASQHEHPREVFHATNKQIRGQMVSLPHLIFPKEEPIQITIYSNKERGCGNILHDKVSKSLREAKLP
jgi:hypothetical protein